MKEKIKQELLARQDIKYKEFHSNLCPGIYNIIGVRVPIVRKYAKELVKNYSIKEILKQIDNEYYEEIMLQGMIIGLDKNNFSEVKQEIEQFIPKINNWAICDTFCAGLKITKKHKKEMWKIIQKYLKSKKEFEIRFAIVMILDYYIEEEYLQQNFEIFEKVKNEGYYAQMAVAWVISECLVKYYNETIKYLQNCKLNDFTYNKSIQKAIESYRISENQKKEFKSKIRSKKHE